MIRKPESASPDRKWQGMGITMCLFACYLLFVSFTDRPPKYENLVSSDAQVTREPYIHKSAVDQIDQLLALFSSDSRRMDRMDPKVYGYPAFELDGKQVWIATGFNEHRHPGSLSMLTKGEKIRVWTWMNGDKKYAWHIAHEHRTVLDYDEIVKRDASNRLFNRVLAAGLVLAGLVLAFVKFQAT